MEPSFAWKSFFVPSSRYSDYRDICSLIRCIRLFVRYEYYSPKFTTHTYYCYSRSGGDPLSRATLGRDRPAESNSHTPPASAFNQSASDVPGTVGSPALPGSGLDTVILTPGLSPRWLLPLLSKSTGRVAGRVPLPAIPPPPRS